MNRIWLPLFAGLITLFAGCLAHSEPAKDETMTSKTMTGAVLYRERMLLPPGATLTVSLEDVSKMDIASTVIATTSNTINGAPPYAFTIDYPAAAIIERNQYNLRATISINDNLTFTSTQQLNPFREPDAAIEIVLSKVAARKTMQKPVSTHADTGLAIVSVNPLAELTNTYWKLLSIDGEPIVMAAQQTKEAFLQMVEDNGAIKGFGGCNYFSGRYNVEGHSLSFSPLASTRKACIYGMEDEAKFLQILDQTAYYSIHKEDLTLLNERKKPIARLQAVYFN